VPVVSVIIPAFRAQATIARAIRSVLDQSIVDWEAIVEADDEIDCATALKHAGVNDSRIRFMSTGRVGSGCHHARNFGLASARGDFIAALDADDLFLPTRLATLLPLASKEGASADNRRVVDDVTGHEICLAFGEDLAQRPLSLQVCSMCLFLYSRWSPANMPSRA